MKKADKRLRRMLGLLAILYILIGICAFIPNPAARGLVLLGISIGIIGVVFWGVYETDKK